MWLVVATLAIGYSQPLAEETTILNVCSKNGGLPKGGLLLAWGQYGGVFFFLVYL